MPKRSRKSILGYLLLQLLTHKKVTGDDHKILGPKVTASISIGVEKNCLESFKDVTKCTSRKKKSCRTVWNSKKLFRKFQGGNKNVSIERKNNTLQFGID